MTSAITNNTKELFTQHSRITIFPTKFPRKMSLNTAHANGGVLIYAGECILLFCDDVELQFEGDNPSFKGSKKGRLYLTTHRMIFTNKSQKDLLQSFSFPFFSMSEVEIEQPVFGANFIKGKVKAQDGGNWTGTARVKLHFKSGGAIEYGKAMLQAAKLSSRNMPQTPQMPPPYTPPSGPYYQAPPPAYTPPAAGYYGFVPPYNAFPDAPPANMVFMTDQPPPYPGINTGYGNPPPPAYGNQPPGYNVMPQTGYPPQQQAPPPGFMMNGYAAANPNPVAPNMSAADAKVWEAQQTQQQSAYYDPNRPNYAYMPPAYNQAPPTYDEATKKSQ